MAEQQATAKVVDIKNTGRQARKPKRARLQAIAAKRYAPGRASTGMLYVRTPDGRRLGFSTEDKRKISTDVQAEWIRRHPRESLSDTDVRYVVSWLESQAETKDPDAPTRDEQAVAAARRMAGTGTELQGWTSEQAAEAYEVRGGALGWHRPIKDGGTVWTPLATFDAEITEETERDDASTDVTRLWRVRVTMPGGGGGEADVTPDQMGRPQQWAARAAGSAAVVMPGPLIADHLRVAVQTRSAPVRRTVFCHTGWRLLDGGWGYITAAGALGSAGLDESVTVDLGSLAGFALPAVPGVREVRAAVRESLALIELAPDKVTAVWLGAVYRAPLPLAADCAPWLWGPSGTFKSEQTALGQQHFGAGMHAKALPGSWMSTGNDLEVTAHMLKDALFVVDDYSPEATQLDARRRAAAADRLIRGLANQAGRGRLRPDGTRRPVKPPRAQVLTSAEDVPPSVESLRARTFVTKVSRGDVGVTMLSTAQQAAAAGVYSTALAAYVQAIAGRYDATAGLPATLAGDRDKYRDTAQSSGHPRSALNVASMALGWHEFLAFAADIEAITAAERDAYWHRAWAALVAVGAEQEAYRKDADPVTIYLTSLHALLAAGRAHVDGRDGGCPAENPERWGWMHDVVGLDSGWRPRGDVIGWIEGDDLYFESSVSYQEARRFAEAAGQPLMTSKRALHEELNERKMLASTGSKGKLAARCRLGGTQQTVVHISVATFDGATS